MRANTPAVRFDGERQGIDLSLGEPCYRPPEGAKAAAAAAILHGDDSYLPSGGLPELRTALAQKLQQQNRIEATANQIVVTTGASLGIFSGLAVLCQPGDGVLIPDPGFPLYDLMLQTQRLRPLRYSLQCDSDCEPDWSSLNPLARQARVMIWNFPSNPLGVVAKPEWFYKLSRLLEANPELYLISDEVYEDLLFSGEQISAAAVVPNSQRILSVFSFSKSYGMTGWRVGYVHAPTEVAYQISKAHWAATMSTPTISQLAALAALRTPRSYHNGVMELLTRNRGHALDSVNKWKLPCLKPNAGFFLWVAIKDFGLDSNTFADRCARECGVSVSPGIFFSPTADDHIRLCFAVETEALREGLARIGQWLNLLDQYKDDRIDPRSMLSSNKV